MVICFRVSPRGGDPAALPTSREQGEGRGTRAAAPREQPRGSAAAAGVASCAEEAAAPEPVRRAGAARDEAAVGRVSRVGHRDDRHEGRKVLHFSQINLNRV